MQAHFLVLAALSYIVALPSPAAAGDVPGGVSPWNIGAVQPGIHRSEDGEWYVGARAGGTNIQRDGFVYGQIANDSNDFSESVTLASIQTPEHDVDTWGGGSQFFAGRQFSENHAGELRFEFALFGADSSMEIPDDDNDLNFYVPYLDGGRFPNPDRPLRAGVYGVRYRDRDPVMVTLNSDTRIFDAGFDYVSTHIDNEGCTLQSVIGPAFIYMDTDYSYVVSGRTIGGWPNPTVVETNEEIQEYFAGAKLGFRSSTGLIDRLSLVLNGSASLFYHHADLDADQNIAGATFIGVTDEEDDFAAKFDVLTGLDFQLRQNLTVGAYYQFGAWLNAANVENPSLSLVDLEGDSRWAGSHPAQLDDQTIFTHAIMTRIVYRF